MCCSGSAVGIVALILLLLCGISNVLWPALIWELAFILAGVDTYNRTPMLVSIGTY